MINERNIRRILMLMAFIAPLLTGEGLGVRLYAQYIVTHLEKPHNTPGSETGALKMGDTVLVYSSMQPQTSRKKNSQFSFGGSQMNIWQARIARDGKLAKPRLSRWGLNTKKEHTGNLCIDPKTKDLYFTRCAIDDPDLRCEIWWARKLKRGWGEPERLRGAVNLREYTATQPAIGRLNDSTAILYFTSDRPGGLGGTDLWYAIVKNGVAGEVVNLGPQVNSANDEITPFYDQVNGVLYFSSNRMGGRGGYDIYCAAGQRNTWQKAEAVCQCLNSEQNDIYFTITDYDDASGLPLAGYLSSNRSGSYYLTDSLCCNDIYEWESLTPAPSPDSRGEPADTVATPLLAGEGPGVRPLFPLFLYFHNDEPDPRSRDSVTAASYADCQRRYASLRGEYLARQKTAADSASIAAFFDSCVVGNYLRVEGLLDYIEEQLDEGHRVELTISGYASPLFTNEYNRLLSGRRIASFINMIRAWREGLFAGAIDDRRLCIIQKPMGVDQLSTLDPLPRPASSKSEPSTSKDPVYSLNAAQARRIEILSCEVR